MNQQINPLNQNNLQTQISHKIEENSEKIKIVLENYKKIMYNINECKEKNKISYPINIMAVTKTVETYLVNAVIKQGISLIGENRVQEFLSKKDEYLPSEIHFIGSLQSNKVKYIINEVSLIQSLDNLKLAKEINRQCIINDKKMDVLIEINAGNEATKGGVPFDEVKKFIEELSIFENISVRGLMAIPPRLANEEIYYKMNNLFNDLQSIKSENVSMDYLSIGMSGDYLTAIKHGSNLVRIGSSLFGARTII